jgi:hypothetical protein
MAEILLNTITLTSTLFIKDRIDVYQRYVTFDEDQHVHEWTTMYCFYVYFQFYYILYIYHYLTPCENMTIVLFFRVKNILLCFDSGPAWVV